MDANINRYIVYTSSMTRLHARNLKRDKRIGACYACCAEFLYIYSAVPILFLDPTIISVVRTKVSPWRRSTLFLRFAGLFSSFRYFQIVRETIRDRRISHLIRTFLRVSASS